MSYVDEVLERIKVVDAGRPEFIQVANEILNSIRPLIAEKEDFYRKLALLERMTEPERVHSFSVPWFDDQGNAHVNRGWRVQFNSAIGPYKGGLRFHPSVNLSVMKFLAFEQIFKNALTGLPIGGGKGGSDFNPKGRSEGELMRFCQSFAVGLYDCIGSDKDSPAGDLGVGGKEIGYIYGMYKRIVRRFDDVSLTGKSTDFGGCAGRVSATGYGAVYFAQELLRDLGTDVKGSTFALSGFGNVAWGVAKKIDELGGKVITLSGPDGYIYDPDGVSGEKVDYMIEMRDSLHDRVQDYADKYGCEFHAGEKPWGRVKADFYVPCATQNDVRLEDAERMVSEGHSTTLIEVANMPTTLEAVDYLTQHMWLVAPSKAVNAAGVACSQLEMSQDSMKAVFTEEEVDAKLHKIMANIYHNISDAAKRYGCEGDLIAGANLASAERVIKAMVGQGVV